MILEKGADLRLEEVSAYLLLLKPNAVPGLIKDLGGFDQFQRTENAL